MRTQFSFAAMGLLACLLISPVLAESTVSERPIRLLSIPDRQASSPYQVAGVSLLSMPSLPQPDTVHSEVLATLLRSSPVSSFIAAPANLGGSTSQFFMMLDLTVRSERSGAEGGEGAASDLFVMVGNETMTMDHFGARMDALVDALAPEKRQIAFLSVGDPENIFAANVAAFEKSISQAAFEMVVITVGEVAEGCRSSVDHPSALIAGIADRLPFGDANGISTAGEVETWLTNALARPSRRDPSCSGTYSLIIRPADDLGLPVAAHTAGASLPDLEAQLYMEMFDAEFLLKSNDDAKIEGYLKSCAYCPHEEALADKLRALKEFAVTSSLETRIWDEIKSDQSRDRLDVYLSNCALCVFRPDAEAAIAEIEVKAAAREAENTAFTQASEANDLAALRIYATSCVVCDHRAKAESTIAKIEADTAYQAEKAALTAALEDKNRPALESWLTSCATCDDRAAAEAALVEIEEAEMLILPCERAAGMPARGGPRQLADIDLVAARRACGAALSVLPKNALLRVLAARIDQAEGKFAEALAAYDAGVEAKVPDAFGLAAYLRFAPPDGTAPDYETAATLARRGAAVGDWLSKEILILLYSRELVAGNGPADAVTLAKESAAEGNVVGQFFLGYFLMSGIGAEVDDAEAEVWLRRASDAGYLRAKPFLAEVLERARGAESWPDEVAGLLWDAFSAGDEIAIIRLTDQLTERPAEVIRIIQQKLRDAGAYKGRDDGLAGPGTVRAVRAYAETLKQSG